jgi:hypothetical protein
MLSGYHLVHVYVLFIEINTFSANTDVFMSGSFSSQSLLEIVSVLPLNKIGERTSFFSLHHL